MSISLKLSLVLFFISLVNISNGAPAKKETCKGAFDVYFVIDRSKSLQKIIVNHFERDAVPFVESLSKMFVSPLMRMSYITFADTADVVMPLTSDRQIIEEKIELLKKIRPDGPTLMNLGIARVNEQIVRRKDKRASIIIALTDGELQHTTKTKSVFQADRARSLGSTLFVVGVSKYDKKQLVDIAGGMSNFVFEATDFDKLGVIADRILDSSCVEILSAEPRHVCINESFEVRIHGRGFNRSGDLSRTRCNFWSDGSGVLMKPTKARDDYLLCRSPDDFYFESERTIVVQVSLNEGLSFISSNVTISAYECKFNSSFLWIALLFVSLLAWTGLWWLWNIITCRKKKEVVPQPKPTRPPPPPPAPTLPHEPKHWPAVDASYYGAAGAGGIKPMPVRWGEKGCTEAAAHLERTKDAKDVVRNTDSSENENSNTVQSPQTEGLCVKLSGIFAPFVAFYTWLASKRPTNTDMKQCVCIRKT